MIIKTIFIRDAVDEKDADAMTPDGVWYSSTIEEADSVLGTIMRLQAQSDDPIEDEEELEDDVY